MLDEALRSVQSAFAIKGVRRVLWFLLVLTMFAICFETQTNYFEINGISKRFDVLEKASQPPLSAEQTARIGKIKDGLLGELETVQAKRANPYAQFLKLFARFIKGAWVAFPLFLIVALLSYLIIKFSDAKGKDEVQGKMMLLYFVGWLGLSVVAWITTLLGINSVLWNTSESIFVSWFVFPICSAFFFIVFIVWIMLLRSLLPNDAKMKVTPPATAP